MVYGAEGVTVWCTRSMVSVLSSHIISVGGVGGGWAGVNKTELRLLSIVAFSSSPSGSVNTESGRRRVCCIGPSNWDIRSKFAGSATGRTSLPGSGVTSSIDTCLESGERGGDGRCDCPREVAGVRNAEVVWLEVPEKLGSTRGTWKSGGSGGTGGTSRSGSDPWRESNGAEAVCACECGIVTGDIVTEEKDAP